MKLEKLKTYKEILILGYGKEGKATEKFLKKFVPDAVVGVADETQGDDYLLKLKNYDLVIKTPGIPKELVTIPYTTATNIFFANTSNRIIGVTGTKGKSTTASLIFAILKQAGKKVNLVGNIGKPMLEELLHEVKSDKIFVCELSSYQLSDIQYSPQIAVVLDLYPEHMNYHGNVEKYYRAKKNIIKYCHPEDFYIYNPNFPILQSWTKDTKAKPIQFEQQIPITDTDIPLIGKHNKENIKAAVTVAHLLKVKDGDIEQAIKMFKPLKHRLQLVGTFKGITFYDDAISTTPESTILAIESIKNIGTLFLGGLDRGYEFSNLIDLIIESKIPNLVFFPGSGEKMLSILRSKTENLPNILEAKTMKEAVEFAYKNTPKGSVCLLSTASPYSLGINFEEKGDQFQTCVSQLQ